jgi:hypothetical protein
MEGILALMIPVLALATGLVRTLRMSPEALGRRRWGRSHGEPLSPAAADPGLADEVALLREELTRVRERLDFTERLLMDAAPAPRIATPSAPIATAPSAAQPSLVG